MLKRLDKPVNCADKIGEDGLTVCGAAKDCYIAPDTNRASPLVQARYQE